MLDEKILHFVWKMKLLPLTSLQTTQGEKIEIIHTGNHNDNAGPDFLLSKIKIGETIWSGHVEIHVKSSDWNLHAHDGNKKYQNIILHVVFENDLKNELPFPTLELKPFLSHDVLTRYRMLMFNQHSIPCYQLLHTVSDFDKKQWIQRLMVERLERKSEQILLQIEKHKGHIEEVFYFQLFKYFGKNTNQDAYEMFTQSLPLKVIVSHKHHLKQLEALIFGQAGFLHQTQDEYSLELKKEYDFLAHKYQLQAMDMFHWNFSRMRPSNFPTVMLAIGASLIHHASHLLSKIIECKNPSEILKLLDAQASEYWNTHYHFNKKNERILPKKLGKTSKITLFINVIIPFLYALGKRNVNEDMQAKALNFLEQLPMEKNAIVLQWEELKMPISNASDTQALIQLKKEYCEKKRCLECNLGWKIIKGDFKTTLPV